MTFLELVQQLRGDCALAGDGPPSVANQAGMPGKLVRWIREAYTEIQALPFEWSFLRSTVMLQVASGVCDYPLGAAPWNRPDIRFFEPEHAILIRGDGSFVRVRPTAFDGFMRVFPVIPPALATPSRLTIMPGAIVRFDARPDGDYTLQATVRLAPQILVADQDVPRMPTEFHSVIVHKARMKYAQHDGDAPLFQAANGEYKAQLANLVAGTVPAFEMKAPPLAT